MAKNDYVVTVGDEFIKVFYPRADKTQGYHTYDEALRQALILEGILKPKGRR